MASKEFQEYKALRALAFEQWEYDAQLYVGPKTIASLLEKGWIERLPEWPDHKRCRITQAGRDALTAMNGANSKDPAHEIRPQIKIADTSIAMVRR